MRIPTSTRRRGATAVEVAIILPVYFILLFGIFLGGILIFNHQEVAWLSREASRRASVRGDQYALETGKPSPTEAQIRQNVILPLAAAMDTSKLTVEVYLIDGTTGTATRWDSSDKAVYVILTDGSKVYNRVRVHVVYASTLLSPTPINLQAVSEVPMAF
jgi:Flp pilus assembly protein TadG